MAWNILRDILSCVWIFSGPHPEHSRRRSTWLDLEYRIGLLAAALQMNSVKNSSEQLLCPIIEKPLPVHDARAELVPEPAMTPERLETADVRGIVALEPLFPVRRPIVVILYKLIRYCGRNFIEIRARQLVEDRVKIVTHLIIGHVVIGAEFVVVSEYLVDDLGDVLDGDALHRRMEGAFCVGKLWTDVDQPPFETLVVEAAWAQQGHLSASSRFDATTFKSERAFKTLPS
jgi:hypothetical protein